MRHQEHEQVVGRSSFDARGLGATLAALTAGMAVVIVAGVSGVIAGAWLLSW